jgi:hypothetical protein
MQGIRDDLQTWKDRGSDGGLIEDMQREVLLIAITPTEQEMKSSVGREVLRSLIYI